MARIVVVSNSATYLRRFRQELLQAMTNLGHDVTALCPSDRYASDQSDLPVERVELPLSQHGMNPLHELKTITAIHRELRRLEPDIVINFTLKPALYGSIAATCARVPRCISVFTGLGHWFTYPQSSVLIERAIRLGLKIALRSNELIVFQNPDDEELFLKEGIAKKGKTRIIDGSGVDVSIFSPRQTMRSTCIFLLVGRLLREKGVREFVAAARLIKRTYADVRFWLLGPIDSSPSAISQEELRAWIDGGDIEYLGEVPDVRKFLAESSVVVLPSYREGTPRSLLEAMAMGKAIITTDAPGCRETVRDGVNGLLVPVGDVPALARAMTRFVHEPHLIESFGAASRAMAVARYDVAKVNAAFLRHLGLVT